MCRYAWHNYRDHFACFECRKAFKYWQWGVTNETEFSQKQKLQHVPREITCPDCKRQMVDMGLDCKAPPNNDADAWEICGPFMSMDLNFNHVAAASDMCHPERFAKYLNGSKHKQRSEAERLLGTFSDLRLPNSVR
jgi:hypothetical protein